MESGLSPLKLLRMVRESSGQYFDPQNAVVPSMKDHSRGAIVISKMVCQDTAICVAEVAGSRRTVVYDENDNIFGLQGDSFESDLTQYWSCAHIRE